MTRRGYTGGFTIIETLLFLAITGLLVATLLGGVGIALNNQRYNDSVQAFKLFLQNQYSDLANVYNDRDSSWQCNSSAATTQPNGGGQVPGQSDCFLMGRYITIDNSALTQTDVVGRSNGGTVTGDDVDLFANYNLNVSKVYTERSTLEWGARIAWPLSGDGSRPAGTSRSMALLLLRSPTSGTIYTFTSDTAIAPEAVTQTNLRNMIVKADTGTTAAAERGQRSRVICIDSQGLSTVGTMSIFIKPKATNAAAIETRSNEVQLSSGVSSQC